VYLTFRKQFNGCSRNIIFENSIENDKAISFWLKFCRLKVTFPEDFCVFLFSWLMHKDEPTILTEKSILVFMLLFGDVRLWIGLIWLRIGAGRGHL
jgi:hypothetical protein